jgi:hypothetical protein
VPAAEFSELALQVIVGSIEFGVAAGGQFIEEIYEAAGV